MKKNLFKTRLLSFAAFCGLALALASCANEDVAQGTTGTDSENDKNLTTFVAGDGAKTRTTMDYNTGAFYWEAGDYIYVKDDDGTWQKSSNAPTGKVAFFTFKVPGKFKNSTSYKVYYPGKNGSNNQVTIPAAQTQAAPNSTAHFGVSGDCGTADASKLSNGSFAFALDHQAAILVFQPYTSNTVLQGCYLSKIEVSSDNDITHTYTLDPTTGELTGAGSGKQVILTTKGSGAYANGFPLNTTSASVTTNGAYMVIKPGTHALKIRYWIKDFGTNVEGTITKNLGSFTYAKNTYYDMKTDLNIRNYDGDHYYMWDAQKQYWDGHEWNKGGSQSTVKEVYGGNEPKYSSTPGPRWANETYPCPDALAPYFKNIINANELSWYLVYGDPCWDRDELWTSMGRLYKSGVWFKKKSVLQAEGHYNSAYSADGTTDLRTTYKYYYGNHSKKASEISLADANKYFFLPTLGFYISGRLKRIGEIGEFWTSTSSPDYSFYSYYLLFHNGRIEMNYERRLVGLRAQLFSDFGDN